MRASGLELGRRAVTAPELELGRHVPEPALQAAGWLETALEEQRLTRASWSTTTTHSSIADGDEAVQPESTACRRARRGRPFLEKWNKPTGFEW